MGAPQWLLPEAATIARPIDLLFWSLVALCALVALAVTAAILFYALRYRRGSGADRSGAHHQSLPVEITWILVPFVIFVGVFVWNLSVFARARTPPVDAQTMYVVAKQWMWKVQHVGGQREINTLHVPLGEPVRLTMTSQDVIHSFYVPAFRVKQDVLPGRYTQLWFEATQLGSFALQCAEYCGLDHSLMGGSVVVMRPAEYTAWLAGHPGGGSLAERGAQLYRSHGCGGCHAPGSTVHAPPLAGVYGSTVHLADGRSVVADERYLRDAMLLPNLVVAAGYAPLMPSFSGQLSEEDVLALIAYLRSLPDGRGGAAR